MPIPRKDSSLELQFTLLEAQRLWWELYREADCLAVPLKRRRMLNARRGYQDAAMRYAAAPLT